MKVSRLASALLAASAAFSLAASAADEHNGEFQLLDRYCSKCHNQDDYYGGLAFELLPTDNLQPNAKVWEKTIRKLRGHLMPPPGADQPPQQDIDRFMARLIDSLDKNAMHSGAGHVPLQRLNRTEFSLAVKDLLDVDINGADFLPAEIEVDGFENIAAALSMSPAFMDQYIGVARAVAHKAVGEPLPKMANVYYPVGRNDGNRSCIFGNGFQFFDINFLRF